MFQNIIDLHKKNQTDSIDKMYFSLSDEESSSFINAVLESNDSDLIETIFLNVSGLTTYKISDEQYLKLIGKDIFYPGIIFRHASDLIIDKLISLFGIKRANNLLLALVWTNNEKIIPFLENADNSKPTWLKELYILPSKYTEEASWEIKNHKINSLIFSDSKKIVKNTLTDNENGLQTMLADSECCKFCENPLTVVFRVNTEHENFKFINAKLKLIDFTTCLSCVPFVDQYMKIGQNGRSTLHNATVAPSYLPSDIKEFYVKIPENYLTLSSYKAEAIYSSNQFILTSVSNVGGYPTWIQDSNFPECPECRNKMMFFGQFNGMEFFENNNGVYVDYFGEGVYYFYLCENCLITSSHYQQS